MLFQVVKSHRTLVEITAGVVAEIRLSEHAHNRCLLGTMADLLISYIGVSFDGVL